MWPKGPPKNWPKEVPQPDPPKPKRKRAQRKSEELDLPPETIDYLRSGDQFDFDPSKVECGPVKLKSLAHLHRDEFTIVTEVRRRTERTRTEVKREAISCAWWT